MIVELTARANGTSLGRDDLARLYDRPRTGSVPEGADSGAAQPWIRVNFVSSLDGSATGSDGVSGSLSSPSDRQVFDTLRCLTDAVLVAAGTVRAEGYVGPLVDAAQQDWRREHGRTRHPGFLIVSRRLDIDPATLEASPVRPVIVTTRSAPPEAVRRLEGLATIARCGNDDVDVAEMRAWMGEHGYRDVLCEGGPSLLGALVAADGLDELCLTLASELVGGDGPRIAHGTAATRDMSLARVLRGDTGDLHLRYLRAR